MHVCVGALLVSTTLKPTKYTPTPGDAGIVAHEMKSEFAPLDSSQPIPRVLTKEEYICVTDPPVEAVIPIHGELSPVM